jgi:ADP-ribose pyrophosphatase YjhB (NUDIX family)
VKRSAGVLFICKGEALLCHSTNSPEWGSWMPPKGGIDIGETPNQAAIRETEEEIGIRVDGGLLDRSFDVLYTNKKGKCYKIVTIFVVEVNSKKLQENWGIQKVGGLQMEEIDRIDWMGRSEIKKRALHRYTDIIISQLK